MKLLEVSIGSEADDMRLVVEEAPEGQGSEVVLVELNHARGCTRPRGTYEDDGEEGPGSRLPSPKALQPSFQGNASEQETHNTRRISSGLILVKIRDQNS